MRLFDALIMSAKKGVQGILYFGVAYMRLEVIAFPWQELPVHCIKFWCTERAVCLRRREIASRLGVPTRKRLRTDTFPEEPLVLLTCIRMAWFLFVTLQKAS